MVDIFKNFPGNFLKKRTEPHILLAKPLDGSKRHRKQISIRIEFFSLRNCTEKNGWENWLHLKMPAEWHCFRILGSSVHRLPCRRRKIPGFVPCRGNMQEGSAQRRGRVELFIFNTRNDLFCLKISELIHCTTCDKYRQLEYMLGLW